MDPGTGSGTIPGANRVLEVSDHIKMRDRNYK